eukprot:4616336-Pyramimonas_sp.AAC.1
MVSGYILPCSPMWYMCPVNNPDGGLGEEHVGTLRGAPGTTRRGQRARETRTGDAKRARGTYTCENEQKGTKVDPMGERARRGTVTNDGHLELLHPEDSNQYIALAG